MDWNRAFEQKKAIALDLDGVLYPERDFLLQVYYLFANFIEYTETTPPASELLSFMKEHFEQSGPSALFERTAERFPEIDGYRENFERLHHQAQLPLKLELFPAMQELIKQSLAAGKLVFVLTAGDPLMQLNKLRQIDWQGLDKSVKVYFEDELRFSGQDPVLYLLDEYALQAEQLIYVGFSERTRTAAADHGVERWNHELITQWYRHE